MGRATRFVAINQTTTPDVAGGNPSDRFFTVPAGRASPQHPQETAFTGGLMLRAIGSELQIPAGYKVRVYDSAAIDTTDDVLTVRILNEDMGE